MKLTFEASKTWIATLVAGEIHPSLGLDSVGQVLVSYLGYIAMKETLLHCSLIGSWPSAAAVSLLPQLRTADSIPCGILQHLVLQVIEQLVPSLAVHKFQRSYLVVPQSQPQMPLAIV